MIRELTEKDIKAAKRGRHFNGGMTWGKMVGKKQLQ